ncbi:MAG: PrgI family protein [Clostridiales bacterium]|nr:PrgI family protein [Clostridiales bacterium]
MSIEVNVPDEITNYKEKIIAGLSFRQLLFGGIALGLGVPSCILLSINGVSDYITMFVTMALVLPPFCLGFVNIKGYRFEVYAKIKLRSLFVKQSRPYATDVEANILPIEVEEFRPLIQKMIREQEQAEAEMKMKEIENKGGFSLFDIFKNYKISMGNADKAGKKNKNKPKVGNGGNRCKSHFPEPDLIEVREKDYKRKRKAAAKALKTAKRAVRSPKSKEKETA